MVSSWRRRWWLYAERRTHASDNYLHLSRTIGDLWKYSSLISLKKAISCCFSNIDDGADETGFEAPGLTFNVLLYEQINKKSKAPIPNEVVHIVPPTDQYVSVSWSYQIIRFWPGRFLHGARCACRHVKAFAAVDSLVKTLQRIRSTWYRRIRCSAVRKNATCKVVRTTTTVEQYCN